MVIQWRKFRRQWRAIESGIESEGLITAFRPRKSRMWFKLWSQRRSDVCKARKFLLTGRRSLTFWQTYLYRKRRTCSVHVFAGENWGLGWACSIFATHFFFSFRFSDRKITLHFPIVSQFSMYISQSCLALRTKRIQVQICLLLSSWRKLCFWWKNIGEVSVIPFSFRQIWEMNIIMKLKIERVTFRDWVIWQVARSRQNQK